MDVVYTGLYRSMDEIVEEAVKETVDVVGISTYRGTHMTVFPELKQALADQGCQNIILFGEGLVPLQDQATLKQTGVADEIFPPAASTEFIVDWIKAAVEGKVNEKNL